MDDGKREQSSFRQSLVSSEWIKRRIEAKGDC